MNKLKKKLRVAKNRKIFFRLLLIVTILVSSAVTSYIIASSVVYSVARQGIMNNQKALLPVYIILFILIGFVYMRYDFFAGWAQELRDDIKRVEESRVFKQNILNLL